MSSSPQLGHAEENLMIHSIGIKNFRCFKDIQLTDLRRFNVIVGPSGSGKTALLEAIFLTSSASPEISFRLRNWRGFNEGIRFNGSRQAYESLFRELFFRFDLSENIQLKLADSERGSRSLYIRYRSTDQLSLNLKSGAGQAMSLDPISFRWKIGDKTYDSEIKFKDSQFTFTASESVYPVWLISPAAPENYADKFSELSKKRLEGPLIDAVRRVFPSIIDLSLESIVGQLSICATVDFLDEKIPIGMVSAGITKFLSILIAIVSNPGGAILIDEMDNGLYFRSYVPMLESIKELCREQQVQLFLTTHSEEFLIAVASVMKAEPAHFSLLKVLHSDGASVIGITRGASAVSTVAQDIEVR